MTWIPVTERLPTKENEWIFCLINKVPVICHVDDATLRFTTGCVYFHWPRKEWIKDSLYAEVSHWMPLPSTEIL